MNRHNIGGLAVAFSTVWLICGCGGQEGPKLVAVTGKVIFDGKPLAPGSIFFHPSSQNTFQDDSPSSLLQIDGSFTVKTFPYGEGVPPGEYVVTLAPDVATRLKKPKYASVQKSPWKVTVPESGLTNYVLHIE